MSKNKKPVPVILKVDENAELKPISATESEMNVDSNLEGKKLEVSKEGDQAAKSLNKDSETVLNGTGQSEPKQAGSWKAKMPTFEAQLKGFESWSVKRWNQLKEQAKTKEFWRNVAIGVGALLLLFMLALNLGWDRAIFPGRVVGVVLDQNNLPLSNVSVSCDNKNTQTGVDGKFQLDAVPHGDIVCKAQFNGFKTAEQSIKLSRFETKDIVFRLESLGYAVVEGKLKSNSNFAAYQIALTVGETSVELNSEGEFKSGELPLGNQKFNLKSPDFKDVVLDINLQPGLNRIEDIELVPAKDLQFAMRNWVTNQPLYEVKINFNEKLQISDQNGNLVVSDLDPNQKVNLSFVKDGYATFVGEYDLSTEIKTPTQINLVPQGKIFYSSEKSGSNKYYVSNYDGGDEVEVAISAGGDVKQPLYTGDKVLFTSSRNKKSNLEVDQAFEYDIKTSKVTQLTAIAPQTSQPGRVTYSVIDLRARKVITVDRIAGLQPNQPSTTNLKIYISEFNGSNGKQIFEQNFENGIIPEVSSALVSSDGNQVALAIRSLQNSNQVDYRVVLVETIQNQQTLAFQTGDQNYQGINLIGFSTGRNWLAFNITKKNGSSEVHVFNIRTKNLKIVPELNTNFVFEPDESNALVIATKEGKSDLYRLDLNSSNLQKISDLGVVSTFYQQDNFVFFENNSEMYILDKNKLDGVRRTGINSNFLMWQK